MSEISQRYEFYQFEELKRDEIEALQNYRLPQAVAQALHAPWYADRLGSANINPEKITTRAALQYLPFTSKEDLRAGMPWEFLAVPKSQVVRMHYSSGTIGLATAVYHTAGDIRRWSECVARGMLQVGVTSDDIFQNMMGYGLFTGGLGLHYPAELIGCMTIPAGAGHTQRQIEIMQKFGTTVIHILPSYAMRTAHSCGERGLHPQEDLSLRIALVGAEPHTPQTRARIEEALGIKAYNCYGLSEMCGPGVAMECPAQEGLHLREDHYLAEIIDPDTREPLPDGEEGELVLTTLTREAMPLLRYRTRDITRILPAQCPCGDQHRRIAPILGRIDDMLIIRGTNVYPMQIERILMDTPEVGSNYLINLDTVDEMDEMTVSIELSDSYPPDDVRQLEGLRQQIRKRLAEELLFRPEVKLVEPHSLPATDGKAERVQDNRRR